MGGGWWPWWVGSAEEDGESLLGVPELDPSFPTAFNYSALQAELDFDLQGGERECEGDSPWAMADVRM